MTHSKPYFLPLFKKYYLMIKSGEQDCEIKPLGHRGWNHKNIYPGRHLNVSNGYQKPGRIIKPITCVNVVNDLKIALIPKWHIDAVGEIYGKRGHWMIAWF